MRIRSGFMFAAVVVALGSLSGLAQVLPGSSSSSNSGKSLNSANACCNEKKTAANPVRLQAYRAELTTTLVQTLANGVKITTESSEIRARDSQNRVLFASTQHMPMGDHLELFTSGNVNDPVERTQINWNSQKKVAWVLKLPPADQQREGCWRSDSGDTRINYGPHPARAIAHKQVSGQGNAAPGGSGGAGGWGGSFAALPALSSESAAAPTLPALIEATMPTREDLGMAEIHGLQAHGSRFTTVIPAGKIGNDKPLAQTTETWMAPGLDFPLRQVLDDPRMGTKTTEVVDIQFSEPPLSIFQAPDGYEVKIEEMHQVPCDDQ